MSGFPTVILVLCTGRCGSMTFARAAAHLPGWTAGHETRTHITGPDRFAWPDRHIEVDNRLSWMLGRLDRAWGDRAAYVHLTRDPEAVARSFADRSAIGIMRAYRTDILARSLARMPRASLIDTCRDYVDTVTENITSFLRDKTHVLPMRLETLSQDFDLFCGWAGIDGDLSAARAELAIRHNATETQA